MDPNTHLLNESFTFEAQSGLPQSNAYYAFIKLRDLACEQNFETYLQVHIFMGERFINWRVQKF